MRIPPGLAGATAGPRVHEVDVRWLMAYAAALSETAPAYLDTGRAGGVLAHPLFPVSYEWPLALELRAGLPAELAVRGVHATHDLRVHRLPRAGDRLSTTARVVAIAPRPPGALVVTRFETVDADAAPVSTTDYGTLYRGVDCEAWGEEPRVPEVAPPASPSRVVSIPVAANLAHVYTECARIWNPIHTDRAVARAAGLPDIILHGTATLGLAVSELVRREAGGDPRRVRGIAGRFGAMVLLPSTVILRRLGTTDTADGPVVTFDALTEDGRPAIRDGRLRLGPR